MATSTSYEEARKQRLEDNKKRFEDLGILKISKSLSDVTNSPKKSPQRDAKLKPKMSLDVSELRRSSRARNPISSYSEEVDIGLPPMRKRSRLSSSWTSYLARPLDEVKMASYEERNYALRQAEKLQSNLQSGHPSFVKSMVRSHVYSCFWLGLPSTFCKDHLSSKDLKMILEDENSSEYDAVYIGSRAGLSGGWRGFALAHKLDDGDAVVFELIEPTRFKVYIVKASNHSSQETDEIIIQKEKSVDKSVSQKLRQKGGANGAGKLKKNVKIVENGKSVKLDVKTSKKVKHARKAKKAVKVVMSVDESVSQKLRQKGGENSAGKLKKVVKFVGDEKSKSPKPQQGEESVDESVSQKLRQKGGAKGAGKLKKNVKIVENGKSISPKLQQEGGSTMVSRKKCVTTKLFRKKVY